MYISDDLSLLLVVVLCLWHLFLCFALRSARAKILPPPIYRNTLACDKTGVP